MNEAKRVILIPHWVHETLTRHQLPISEALNFNTLHRLVSANDLAGFILLNRYAHHTGIEERKPGAQSADIMGGVFINCANLERDHEQYLFDVVYPLTNMQQFQEELVDRLFSPDARSSNGGGGIYEKPFNIYDLSPEYQGVVIYPGFFTGEAGSEHHEFNLVEEVVKALYVYAPLHEVASTAVFLRYLGLLSKKRIMV